MRTIKFIVEVQVAENTHLREARAMFQAATVGRKTDAYEVVKVTRAYSPKA